MPGVHYLQASQQPIARQCMQTARSIHSLLWWTAHGFTRTSWPSSLPGGSTAALRQASTFHLRVPQQPIAMGSHRQSRQHSTACASLDTRAATTCGPQHYWQTNASIAVQGKAFQLIGRSVFLSVRDRRGCSVNQEEPELEDVQAAFTHWLSPTSIRAATARAPQHAMAKPICYCNCSTGASPLHKGATVLPRSSSAVTTRANH